MSLFHLYLSSCVILICLFSKCVLVYNSFHILSALKLIFLLFAQLVFICLFFKSIASMPRFTMTNIILEAAIFHSSLPVAIHHVVFCCEAVLTTQLLPWHTACVWMAT